VPFELRGLLVRENLTTGCLFHVRQRHKPGRQQTPLADLVGAHGVELIPGGTRGKLDSDPALYGLASPDIMTLA
jgi:hypothetical protein